MSRSASLHLGFACMQSAWRLWLRASTPWVRCPAIPQSRTRRVPDRNFHRMLRQLLVFAIAFWLIQAAYESTRGTWFERTIIDDLTVRPSAAVINLLDPGIAARADGARIISRRSTLNILAGCEGSDVVFLLAAAMIAAWRGLRATVIGVAAGLLIVYVANLTRVVTIFFASVESPRRFALVHGYIAPIAVVVVAVVAFSLWLAWATSDEPGRAA